MYTFAPISLAPICRLAAALSTATNLEPIQRLGYVEHISATLLVRLDTVDIYTDVPAQDEFWRLVAHKQCRVR